MQRPERGATDRGYRDRLLALLRNRARELGRTQQRLQQRLAFERLLARGFWDPVLLDTVLGKRWLPE